MLKLSIKQFLENPEENSTEYYNFYDWFCSKESLLNRMKKLVPKLKFFADEGLIDIDNNYVWFKNNCPCEGKLYDDIRISSLNEDDTYKGGFCPKTGHTNELEEFSIWGFGFGEFKNLNSADWKNFKKEIKTNPKFKEEVKQLLS